MNSFEESPGISKIDNPSNNEDLNKYLLKKEVISTQDFSETVAESAELTKKEDEALKITNGAKSVLNKYNEVCINRLQDELSTSLLKYPTSPEVKQFLYELKSEVEQSRLEILKPESNNDKDSFNSILKSIQGKTSDLLLQYPTSPEIKSFVIEMKAEIDKIGTEFTQLEQEEVNEPEQQYDEHNDINQYSSIISEFNSQLARLDSNSFIFESGTFNPNPEWQAEIDQELEKKFNFIKSTLNIYGYEINNDSDLPGLLSKIREDRERLTQGVFAKFRNRKKIEILDRLLSKKDEMFYEYVGLKNRKDLYLEKYSILNNKYKQLPQFIKDKLLNVSGPTQELIIQTTNKGLEKLNPSKSGREK
jgi:hypothetical protein